MNLRDSRVYDTIEEDGKEKRVLNQNETTLAQQKQQAIKDAFAGWVLKDPQQRPYCEKVQRAFNSTAPVNTMVPIHFVGMKPGDQFASIGAMRLPMCCMGTTPFGTRSRCRQEF